MSLHVASKYSSLNVANAFSRMHSFVVQMIQLQPIGYVDVVFTQLYFNLRLAYAHSFCKCERSIDTGEMII
jgi:hypothetical protein